MSPRMRIASLGRSVHVLRAQRCLSASASPAAATARQYQEAFADNKDCKCCEKSHEQGKRCPNTLHTGTFARLTQPYDPAIPITTEQIPPEYNNPQTAQFCELTDIENKFHLSNEEREARIAAGPRPVESRQSFSRHPRRYGGYGGYGPYMVEGAVEMVEVSSWPLQGKFEGHLP